MVEKLIQSHLQNVVNLFPDKIAELEKECGFKINPDGTCTAKDFNDVKKYLAGVKKVLGDLSFISAKVHIQNAAYKAGLDEKEIKELLG